MITKRNTIKKQQTIAHYPPVDERVFHDIFIYAFYMILSEEGMKEMTIEEKKEGAIVYIYKTHANICIRK
jgi:hypothetical protein